MAYQPKSYKKFVATAATATLVASAIAPVASAATFSDVNDRYKEAVDYLASRGITEGYPNGKFGTNDNIKRQDAAVMVARALGATPNGNYPNKGFTDVPADRQWAVNFLADKGIVSGKAAGEFGANDFMTRGEMAKVIANAYEFVGDPNNAFPFTDVSDTFKQYVDALQEAGVAQGKTATQFGTGDNITRGEFALFVHRAETYVPANPAVVSVVPVNAKELQVVFNQAIDKSSVVEQSGANKGTLVDGVFKVNNASADALKASLSSDGKTLTITAGTGATWEGTNSIELLADKAEATSGKKVPHFAKAFTFDDTTRATITGVDFNNKYSYTVNFSEPVTTVGNVTATFADGTTATLLNTSGLAADGKSYTLNFDTNTAQNKEITVNFSALQDFAGNYSTPQSAKVTISDADQTKPSVVSATATSLTTVQVKFSEVVTLNDASKVTFNGTQVGSGNVAVDSSDKTVLNVTVPKTTTSGVLAIGAGAVKDLNTNDNVAFSQTVSFAVDKTAPVVTSQEVKRENNQNKLVLTFSEDVTKASAADLTLRYTDEYGVARTVTVPNANVVVDSNDASKVVVTLANANGNLKADVNYAFDLPSGYFVDGFENKSTATTISFLNSATDTATKLKLIATNPIVTTDVDGNGSTATRQTDGAFVDVQFADAVDATSARVASNYSVEGAEVTKAELVYNNPTTATANGAKAVVRVYIKDNTVDLTGYYNVTVRGVKGYSSNVGTMSDATHNVQIVENVRPTVASSAVKSFNANQTVLTVTFSEAIAAGAGDTNDFELYVDGSKVSGSTVTTGTAGSTVEFTINTDLSDEIAAGKSVKLVATSTLDLRDAQGNVASVNEIVVR